MWCSLFECFCSTDLFSWLFSEIPTHLLFVFVIHMRQRVKHEMKSHKTCTGYTTINNRYKHTSSLTLFSDWGPDRTESRSLGFEYGTSFVVFTYHRKMVNAEGRSFSWSAISVTLCIYWYSVGYHGIVHPFQWELRNSRRHNNLHHPRLLVLESHAVHFGVDSDKRSKNQSCWHRSLVQWRWFCRWQWKTLRLLWNWSLEHSHINVYARRTISVNSVVCNDKKQNTNLQHSVLHFQKRTYFRNAVLQVRCCDK